MGRLKPAEAAKRIGVSVKTLQRWDKEGILVAKRQPSGRRYYEEEVIKGMYDNETGIDFKAAVIRDAVVIEDKGSKIVVAAGDTVNICTDSTDFEDEYVLRVVESIDKSEVRLDTGECIPWEYILSIDVDNS